MQFIDEKFKDSTPNATVEKIRGILKDLDIQLYERWYDSGIENCNSMSVYANNGLPGYNGKGISKEFARASAHAEFIERLQGDLILTKYQSIKRQKEVDLQSYAPDGKYMTVEELIENGQWMDYIVEAYKDPLITRQSIAERCRIYACADDGRILTVPFYSLFEGKYVYLPIAFVDQMYRANGCCAGNTREEAWIHALSEMMERYGALRVLLSGQAAPKIPLEKLEKYPAANKIIKRILETGQYEVEVFDYSIGNGFPVISTRIIDKKNHNYCVNIGADPVFEIALQRTLTELFQGKNIDSFFIRHNGKILKKVSDFPVSNNAINQLQTGNGVYTADYFANELTCTAEPTEFADNSGKTNKELLSYMLGLYRQLGKPVYVRNFSYLGFHSYRFVVPGFSESRWVQLNEVIPDYALADSVCATFRDVAAASDEDLNWMLSYCGTLKNDYGRDDSFGKIAGIPLKGVQEKFITAVTKAYAAYRLKRYADAAAFLRGLDEGGDPVAAYFACVNKYLALKTAGIREDKIRVILYKFFRKEYADRLYEKLDQGKTPYDDYLIRCDYSSCQGCACEKFCSYNGIKSIVAKVGPIYQKFINGQDASQFAIE